MSLLTALILINSHILSGIYSIFLEKCPIPNLKGFNMKFEPQWKGHKNSYGARQILVLFCKQVALILGSNCVKGLKGLIVIVSCRLKLIEFLWHSTLWCYSD